MSTVERHSVIYAQNFLHSSHLVDRLLDLSTIGPDDLVYEIGPGKGLITARLAERCRRVVAVEKDRHLAACLRRRFAGSPHVSILDGDAVCAPLPTPPYKVFANIPFNATAAIVTTLTTASHPPDDIYLAMQKEAAGKYCGQPRESLYAVLLKPWFEPEIVYRFQRTDFVPAPNVDVVILRLRKRGPPLVSRRDAPLFRDFVSYAFTAWQPCLRDTLIPISGHRQLMRAYHHAALPPDATPTAVHFEQWLALFHHLKDAPRIQAVAGAERRLRAQQAGLHRIHRTRSSGNTSLGACPRHSAANLATRPHP